MYENIYGSKVAYCSTCKATFPTSWFQTRGAIRKDGVAFCSKKCEDNYQPESSHHGIVELFATTHAPRGIERK